MGSRYADPVTERKDAMPPMSPTVASWELNLRLKARRVEIGMDVAVICKTLGFTRNYWSAVENDRKILAADKLDRLLDLLEYDKDEKRELLNLREEAKNRGWWTAYSALFDDEILRLFGLEHGAQAVRTYESLLIPGLLQTADYARALMSSNLGVRPIEVDQRLEVRLRRQQRLFGDDPLHLTVIMSQAALLQETGGLRVLVGQLAHLAKMIENLPETLHVRVVPFTATTYDLFGASTFHLIDFASTRLPTLAWQEMATSWGILPNNEAVRGLNLVYREGYEHSLSREDSYELIMQRIKELEP